MKNYLRRTSSLLALFVVGCGDADVPDTPSFDALVPDTPVDAIPVDACSCQREPWADRVTQKRYRILFMGASYDVASTCAAVPDFTPGTRSLGGGTSQESGPIEELTWITTMGPWWPDIAFSPLPEEESTILWMAIWATPIIEQQHHILATTSCLRPPTEGDPHQRQLEATRSTEFARIPPENTMFDSRASCREGMLIGGACSMNPLQDHDSELVRAGFDPADPGQWLCSWSSDARDTDIEIAVTAYCLEETMPAEQSCCSPLEESVVFRQNIGYVLPGANRMEISCEPGELLLHGTCMLDEVDSALMDGITMFRSGFPPTEEFPDGDPGYWGCSWYNRTDVVPRAIATAVCLRPD